MTIKAQLETLSVSKDEALAKAKELTEAGIESPESLTDEVTAQIDELMASATTDDGAIKELLAQDEAIKARLVAIDSFEDRSAAIAGARGVHVPGQPADREPSAKIPAKCMRHGKITNFTDTVDGVTPQERAYRFGQYCMAKLSTDMPGKFNFPTALAFSRDQFGFQPTAVHGEGGSDTSGSHVFVPDEFGMDLIKLRELYGVARGVFKMRTMASDTRTDPRRTGGLTSYFVGENTAGTESDASYDSVTLTAQKLMAITRMSAELNEDSVIDFGNELAGEISYAFSNKEDSVAFNGTGISTDGGISGIRTQLDTLTAGTAPGLALGAGNGYDELTLANFEAVVGGLPQFADVPGQVFWICHKTFYHTVMQSLMNAAGGNTSAVLAAAGIQSFLGYPVRFSQVFPSTTANDQIPVVFGNFAQGASFGDRRQETISFSDSATVGGQSMWERDQIGVKGTQRFDIVVHDFGTDSAAGPICGLQMAGS